jgi:alkylation response protein AidB-like acyl-CoA dehydrogenase
LRFAPGGQYIGIKWDVKGGYIMDYLDIDLNLTDEDLAIQEHAHKFAENVMRPISKEVDGMEPDQVVADGSPLYTFLEKAYELGFHAADFPKEFGGAGVTHRQAQIADGNTEVLQRYGGQLLMQIYPRTRNSMLSVLRSE